MRVGAYRALGVVLGCLLVAGCASDGGEDPVTLPPATAGTTPEPTESSSPPTSASSGDPTPTTTLVLPDQHVESVDAFVVEFFAALNAAKDSGDFSAYDAMYLPQCTGCVELRAEVVGWLEDGQTVEGGDWVILQQSSTAFPDGSRAGADVFGYREVSIIASPEETTMQSKVTPIQWFQFGLLPGEEWVIEDMGFSNLELP